MKTIEDNQIVPGIFKSTQKPGEYKPITSTPHKYVQKKRTSQRSKPWFKSYGQKVLEMTIQLRRGATYISTRLFT